MIGSTVSESALMLAAVTFDAGNSDFCQYVPLGRGHGAVSLKLRTRRSRQVLSLMFVLSSPLMSVFLNV